MISPAEPDEPLDHDRSANFEVIAAFELGLALIALAIGWFFSFDPRHDLKPGISLASVVRHGVQGLVATLPLFLGFLIINQASWKPAQYVRDFVRQHITPWIRPLPVWQLIILGMCAGIGEELLFRGAIQFVAYRWMPAATAVILSSILFGVAHFITWWYALLAGLASLYLGWVFVTTGSLLPPIVAHAVYDIVVLVYLCLLYTSDAADE